MRFNHHYILKCLSVLDKKFKTLQTVKTILCKNGVKDETCEQLLILSEREMLVSHKSFHPA